MDYEKILKGIVQIINTTENSDIGFANICTYIGENCPELTESEDERMRKEILEFVSIVADSKSNKMEWIAWLEKQGEKKNVDVESLSKAILASHGDPFKKPKWTEEDDGVVACIKSHLRQSLTYEAYTSYRRWLDSLKQRMEE